MCHGRPAEPQMLRREVREGKKEGKEERGEEDEKDQSA